VTKSSGVRSGGRDGGRGGGGGQQAHGSSNQITDGKNATIQVWLTSISKRLIMAMSMKSLMMK